MAWDALSEDEHLSEHDESREHAAWATLSDGWDSASSSPMGAPQSPAPSTPRDARDVGIGENRLVLQPLEALGPTALGATTKADDDDDEYGHDLPPLRLPQGKLRHRAAAALLQPVVECVRPRARDVAIRVGDEVDSMVAGRDGADDGDILHAGDAVPPTSVARSFAADGSELCSEICACGQGARMLLADPNGYLGTPAARS